VLPDIELQMLHEAIELSLRLQCTPVAPPVLSGLQSLQRVRLATGTSAPCQHNEAVEQSQGESLCQTPTTPDSACVTFERLHCDCESEGLKARTHAPLMHHADLEAMSPHTYAAAEMPQRCRRLRAALKQQELAILLAADTQHKAKLIRDYNSLFAEYQRCKAARQLQIPTDRTASDTDSDWPRLHGRQR
jgi:hypothetical protein